MKAMIFAAGLGTRLKPLTDVMPKALVPVEGKPLLWHTIQKLKNSGFDELIINVHHFAEQIIDYVKINNYFDIRIEFSDERDQLLDTGGGIKKASWFFDEGKPFLIHNVDILSNLDLRNLYNHFTENDADACVVVSQRKTERYLLFDERSILRGWVNKKTGAVKSPILNFDPTHFNEYAFSGIHMLSPAILELMDSFPDKFSIIDFYISIINDRDILAYHPEQLNILDVGKPESLTTAANFLETHLD